VSIAASDITYFAVYHDIPHALLALAISLILLAITVVDIRTTEIPNGLILALVPFAGAWVWSGGYLFSSVIGFFVVSVPMLLLALVVQGAFGGGDIKLMAVCGFMLGWQDTLLAFAIAIVFGGSYAIFLLVSGKKGRDGHIPFAPALCAGVFLAMFFGQTVFDFYRGLLYG